MNVERSLSDLHIAQGEAELAHSEAKVTRDMVRVNEARFSEGRIGPKEMEDSQSLLWQKELALLQGDQILFQRQLELLRAAGQISSALQ